MAITVANPPTKLALPDVMGILDAGGQVAKSCRFIVRISATSPGSSLTRIGNFKAATEQLTYMCDAAEFPGRGFNVTETRYYGPSQAFPNNTLYNPITLSFICRNDGTERRFFDDWMEEINPTTSFHFSYPDQYYAQVEVFQLSEVGASKTTPEVIYAWRLHKAWPTFVAPQAVTWADQDILRMQVTFTYKYWDRL